MSYVVEIIRPISKEEILAIVDEDEELSVIASGDEWIELIWIRNGCTDSIHFAQSRLICASPETETWEKLQEVATRLNAEVIGEEDKIAPSPVGDQGIFRGRSTWIGWPLLVLGLVVALWWRW